VSYPPGGAERRLIDAETAARLSLALEAIALELEAATALAARAEELRQALINAIAAGAATMSDSSDGSRG
jgi:hypothetical protein